MDAMDVIRARRDTLAAQKAQAEQEYNALEARLALLQRNLDAMHGGLQELEALLAGDEAQDNAT